jgi:hypothetical protein
MSQIQNKKKPNYDQERRWQSCALQWGVSTDGKSDKVDREAGKGDDNERSRRYEGRGQSRSACHANRRQEQPARNHKGK